MQKIASTKRVQVLSCLMEGTSVRATSRITGVAKNTILKYLEEAGEACSEYQHKHMVNLPCKVLQLDEIWSFIGCKQKVKETRGSNHLGDCWTWTAICAETKLMPSWRVGDRSGCTAFAFCADLAGRFSGKLQITSDGLESYKWAVGAHFPEADFAQLVKIYAMDDAAGREICVGAVKTPVFGTPDIDLVSTSYIERSNLTIRMGNRRFTRKTNGHSKKVANHCHMLAINFMHYNYGRKHMSLKRTPAQAAGIADHQWTVAEIVAMVETYWSDKEEAEFAEAFELKYSPIRVTPKTFPPTPYRRTPWYLDPESGGKNPDERKPGIDYDD